MNVVIVCDLISTFLRFRRFLAKQMSDAGHEVTVIGSVNDADDTRFFSENSIGLSIVKMDRTGLNPFSDWRYSRSLTNKFRELCPNRILAYQAKAAVWSAIAAKSLDDCHVSILFPGLGYLFAPNPTKKQRLIQLLSRPLYRHAFSEIDVAFFQNSDDIATMRKAKILSDKTNAVLVNGSGVSLDEFLCSTAPTSPMRFVMATRLLADKGIREFADVAGDLVSRYGAKVEFHIAGSFDTHPNAIRPEEMEKWNAAGWINYQGHVSDMVKFLTECSAFILPSYYMEGTPRSILEALSVGRAIVTTDNRGCKETVEEGVNGFIVQQKSRQSLLEAIEKLIQNPDLVVRMGLQSRRIAEEKYDVNSVCNNMIDAMGLENLTDHE